MKIKFKISVLIPAFNYLNGVKKILLESDIIKHDSIEILIYDNSENDDIKVFIEKLVLENNIAPERLKYLRTKTPNYIDNWNKLIQDCNGEYFVLIHHDEFLVDKNFFKILLNSDYRNFDLIVFKAKLFAGDKSFFHFPISITKILMKTPKFILIKNFFGPTATLLLRNNLKQNFDRNLRWLVDSDFYYRIISKKLKFKIMNKSIGSNLDYENSITKKIDNNLKLINKNEEKYIYNKYDLKKIKYSPMIVLFLIIKKLYNIFSITK